MQKLTSARRVVDILECYGVNVVFGIPGVHTLPLYEALGEARLRHVLPRHEQGAAFMADGYARASGKYAACFLVTGPGVLNAATGIGQAYSDSIPMLVVATVNERGRIGLGRGDLHETLNQQAALSGLTETVLTIGSASAMDEALREAHVACTAGRRRPACLSVPLDVLSAEHPGGELRVPVLPPPVPPPRAIEAAAERLRKSLRPVILAGGGAIGAAEAVLMLAGRLGAMVATTIAGKGIVDERSQHNLGAAFKAKEMQPLLSEADLLLVVGSELAYRDVGELDHLAGLPVLRIDICARTLTRGLVPDLALQGDARETLELLLARLGEASCPPWAENACALRSAVRQRIGTGREHQLAFLDRLRSALPDDAIIATDMTQIAYTGNTVFQARKPGTWLHPVGYGTLGWALPAAIGARLARPETPVVALVGDYAFGFTASELATAADLELGLPVIVWNNRRPLDVIREMNAVGIASRIGVEPGGIDFAALATAHRCRYAMAKPGESLDHLLARALSANGPTLIEIDASADLDGSFSV
jgi:5-guanidino-2-oxopentanoate decarboxylase